MSGGVNWGYYWSSYASNSCISHNGWTEPFVFADFENNIDVVILFNRIHAPVIGGQENMNTFAFQGNSSQTWKMISNHVYKDLLNKKDIVNHLPNLKNNQQKIKVSDRVYLNFEDEISNNPIGVMNGQKVMVYYSQQRRNDINKLENSYWLFGSKIIKPEWGTLNNVNKDVSKVYSFVANKKGYYYIGIFDLDNNTSKVFEYLSIR